MMAALTALQGQVNAQAATILQLQAAPPDPIPDMLTPGDFLGPINMRSTDGIKLNKQAIAALSITITDNYLMLSTVTYAINIRADVVGWYTAGVFTVATANGPRDLMDQKAQITKAELDAHVEMYINTSNRMAQSAKQLAQMLDASMDPQLKIRVMSRRPEFTYQTTAGPEIEDGVAMLYLLFGIIDVSTEAKVANIERQLETNKLVDKLQELDYDIPAFNLHLRECIRMLVCCGEREPNMVSKLFTVLKGTPDGAFADTMKFQESQWESHRATFTNSQLMVEAEDKYNTIVQKGEWKATSKLDEHVIALVAAQLQTQKQPATVKAAPNSGNGGGRNRASANLEGDYAWKKVAPKPGEPTEKTWRKKVYIYCPHHGELKWVLKTGHANGCKLDPSYCAPVNEADAAPAATKPKGATRAPTAQETMYARALVAAMAENEEHGGDDENEDE